MTNKEYKLMLGETEIAIYEHGELANDGIVFLNVHEDETTSLEALKAYGELYSIYYFYLEHQKTRRVQFVTDGQTFSVDPNRIFTKKGRKKTLLDAGAKTKKAKQYAKQLAQAILKKLEQAKVVIAVHNNTDENYSIKSYLPGGDEAQNTDLVYVNEKEDPDDFIYTTDNEFYHAFKSRRINVILQDNKKYVNDGSLSVYCGKNNIRYVNIETQRGHFDAQMKLIQMVHDILAEELKNK